MAGIGSQARRSIQMYWMRRNYQRLGSPTRQLRVVRLGGGGRSGSGRRLASSVRLSWKARAARHVVRLRSAVWSPIRLLAKLRDAYVDTMLALAGGEGRPSPALSNSRSGAEGLWVKRMPKARQASVRNGDFERMMMMHIYSMLVTPELPCAPKA